MSEEKSAGRIRVTLLKSLAGRLRIHQQCVAGLGLRRLHQSVELEDTPAVMGMVNKVAFMLCVERL
ncbi:MAG TPA: 50S ribosomal protein L30 [Nevskiaceae bacterium]|nr:50S ribosomal protein L30 [Nevskiaceae bacterium]